MNRKVEDVKVRTILGPKQEDEFGEFYLVEGNDGALYKKNSVSGDMFFIVGEGDWDLASDIVLDEMGIESIQKGVDSLRGRKVILSDKYPDNHLSETLIKTGLISKATEDKSIIESVEEVSTDLKVDPYSVKTLLQDQSQMPLENTPDSLRNFLSDNMDMLSEEMQE
tara:strand:- start:263 stop:763 length:501 start_codon:yes stop_codon:yes gene_type:complete